jgi:hypothetical protein
MRARSTPKPASRSAALNSAGVRGGFCLKLKGRMVRPHAGNRVEAGGDLVHALVALPAD